MYYDILQTPVQINNRLAILPSTNAFLLNFLGIRYLNTDMNYIPDGYHKVAETNHFTQTLNDNQVLVENETVLPIAYVTSSSINDSQFQAMNAYEQLDVITRFTIIPDDKKQAVIIDINHTRNKLSGKTAPYPNGNSTFHYQFSEGAPNGLQTLDITLSKGNYLLKDFNWHTYEKQLLSQKHYTTVETLPLEENEIISCRTNANAGNYFVTSICKIDWKYWLTGNPFLC